MSEQGQAAGEERKESRAGPAAANAAPSGLAKWAADELRPRALARSLSAGVLTYILEVIVVVSFAALVFSGGLAGQLPLGLGLVIAGDAVLCAVVALFSSFPGSIAVEQDVPSAVLALAAASLVAGMPGSGTAAQFSTAVVMLVGTALATGLFFILLGVLRLGGLARFLPYPVMGGFLAGTGWLLSVGAVGVMTSASSIGDVFHPAALSHWLPGALFGLVMLLTVNRAKSALVLPACAAAGIVLFYLLAALTGTSLAALSAGGWLLGPFTTGSAWQFPLSPEILAQTNWPALLSALPELASVPIISVIALLLNESGLELVVGRDIDPNRELVTAGLGNMAGGLAGGLVGYHAISLSTLNYRLAGSRRLPGLVTGVLLVLTLFLSAAVLNLLPRFILGGLLFYLGLSLLDDWVRRAWSKFRRLDFLVILLILGVIALGGFLEGIALGLVLTILIFVIEYSRTSVVKYGVTGASYHSRVVRSAAEQAVLSGHGNALYILKLQGYIFFGTAKALSDRIRERVREAPSLRFVVLDLALVSGLDSTGALGLSRVVQLLKERGIALVLTGAMPSVRREFEQGGLGSQAGTVQFFPDLDHGVEWCENRIVKAAQAVGGPENGLAEQLGGILTSAGEVERLLKYMQRREVARGERLIRQGDEPDLLYFVESGQLTVELQEPGREPLRLQTMRGGRAVGEIGFYLGIKRTADVIADEPSIVYCLSRQNLAEIERSDPEAASTLHRVVVQGLAERVVQMTAVVDALER